MLSVIDWLLLLSLFLLCSGIFKTVIQRWSIWSSVDEIKQGQAWGQVRLVGFVEIGCEWVRCLLFGDVRRASKVLGKIG